MRHSNTSRQERAIKRVKMTGWLTAIAIVFFTVNGLAQGGVTHTFFFDNDLKQYSIETVPHSDAYALAGTYAVTPGFSGIHFVYYDPAAGGIVTSKVFYIPNRDIRSVDITVVDNRSFFITALMRDNLVSNGKDRIKVLKVNDQGTILMSAVLESAVNTPAGYRNMYPLHSIYLDDKLYICGYVGRSFYTYPNVPYFGTQDSKQAFVLHFDPGAFNVVCRTWDYVITPTQTTPTDYDMAMRMIPVTDEDIYVTGSCNTAIPGFSGDQFPSATLSLFLDKNTLTTGGMTPQGTPFVNRHATGANTGNGEFGIGILPDPDGSGGFFVVGNDFFF